MTDGLHSVKGEHDILGSQCIPTLKLDAIPDLERIAGSFTFPAFSKVGNKSRSSLTWDYQRVVHIEHQYCVGIIRSLGWIKFPDGNFIKPQDCFSLGSKTCNRYQDSCK